MDKKKQSGWVKHNSKTVYNPLTREYNLSVKRQADNQRPGEQPNTGMAFTAAFKAAGGKL